MIDSALVITVSTRAAAGVYEDKSGPIIAAALDDLGFDGGGPGRSCPTETRSVQRCAMR